MHSHCRTFWNTENLFEKVIQNLSTLKLITINILMVPYCLTYVLVGICVHSYSTYKILGM